MRRLLCLVEPSATSQVGKIAFDCPFLYNDAQFQEWFFCTIRHQAHMDTLEPAVLCSEHLLDCCKKPKKQNAEKTFNVLIWQKQGIHS